MRGFRHACIHPIAAVDTRGYYNYNKRTNDSTDVVYSAASIVNCSGGPCENDLYEFTKNNVGVDWPVMERLMLKGSILYYETDGSANTNSTP